MLGVLSCEDRKAEVRSPEGLIAGVGLWEGYSDCWIRITMRTEEFLKDFLFTIAIHIDSRE